MVKMSDTRPIAQAAKQMSSVLGSSRDDVLKNFRIALLGAPTKGKTTVALTASEHLENINPPENAGKDWINCKDVVVFQYDCGGVDTLSGWHIEVPTKNFSLMYYEEMKEAEKHMFATVAKLIKDGVVKTVVVSSITSRSKVALAWCTAKPGNNQVIYNYLQKEQIDYFQRLRGLACNLVIESHGKLVSVFETEKQPESAVRARKNLKAMGLEEGDIRMDIDGQAHGYYRNNLSMIIPVTLSGGKRDKKCLIHPNGKEGFESKNRFVGLDQDEEPHLGKLFKKIRQHNS